MRQITGLSQKMVLTNDIVIIDIQAMSFFTSFTSFSWQDPVHSWKAVPGEVMNVENLFYIRIKNAHLETL